MNYRDAAVRPDERVRQAAAGKKAALLPAVCSPSKYAPRLETVDCGAAIRRRRAIARRA
jgi:hypothetical protein